MKLVALATALILSGCTQGPTPPPSAHPSPQPTVDPPECPPDPPKTELGGLEFSLLESPVEDILRAVREARAPQLPPHGLMSEAHVCGGRVDSVLIEVRFDHGADLYYYPAEVSSEEQFVREIRSEFRDPEAPLPGRILPFRGTRAGALETDDTGPAWVGWLEGSYELDLYGRGRQPLRELLALGNTLVGAR